MTRHMYSFHLPKCSLTLTQKNVEYICFFLFNKLTQKILNHNRHKKIPESYSTTTCWLGTIMYKWIQVVFLYEHRCFFLMFDLFSFQNCDFHYRNKYYFLLKKKRFLLLWIEKVGRISSNVMKINALSLVASFFQIDIYSYEWTLHNNMYK